MDPMKMAAAGGRDQRRPGPAGEVAEFLREMHLDALEPLLADLRVSYRDRAGRAQQLGNFPSDGEGNSPTAIADQMRYAEDHPETTFVCLVREWKSLELHLFRGKVSLAISVPFPSVPMEAPGPGEMEREAMNTAEGIVRGSILERLGALAGDGERIAILSSPLSPHVVALYPRNALEGPNFDTTVRGLGALRVGELAGSDVQDFADWERALLETNVFPPIAPR